MIYLISNIISNNAYNYLSFIHDKYSEDDFKYIIIDVNMVHNKQLNIDLFLNFIYNSTLPPKVKVKEYDYNNCKLNNNNFNYIIHDFRIEMIVADDGYHYYDSMITNIKNYNNNSKNNKDIINYDYNNFGCIPKVLKMIIKLLISDNNKLYNELFSNKIISCRDMINILNNNNMGLYYKDILIFKDLLVVNKIIEFHTNKNKINTIKLKEYILKDDTITDYIYNKYINSIKEISIEYNDIRPFFDYLKENCSLIFNKYITKNNFIAAFIKYFETIDYQIINNLKETYIEDDDNHNKLYNIIDAEKYFYNLLTKNKKKYNFNFFQNKLNIYFNNNNIFKTLKKYLEPYIVNKDYTYYLRLVMKYKYESKSISINDINNALMECIPFINLDIISIINIAIEVKTVEKILYEEYFNKLNKKIIS